MLAPISAATASSAGTTACGWRVFSPRFGVTTNRAVRRSSALIVAWTWIQKLDEASAKAPNV